MPNYVKNILKIDFNGKDKDYQNNFFRCIEGAKSVISFDKIIPMPPSLAIDACSRNNLAMKAVMLRLLMTEKNRHMICYNPYLPLGEEEYRKLIENTEEEYNKTVKYIPEDEMTNFLDLGLKCIRNKIIYGETDWHGWRVKNWGTKWDACDCMMGIETVNGGSYKLTVLEFDTAWSTPKPVILKLSTMFPEITFELLYADEAIGNNCGHLVFEDGVFQEIDIGNPTEFANKVWDNCFDDILEEDE